MAASIWAQTVASAAPPIPIRGNPNSPNIRPQANTAFSASEIKVTQVTDNGPPHAGKPSRKRRSHNRKSEPATQITK